MKIILNHQRSDWEANLLGHLSVAAKFQALELEFTVSIPLQNQRKSKSHSTNGMYIMWNVYRHCVSLHNLQTELMI